MFFALGQAQFRFTTPFSGLLSVRAGASHPCALGKIHFQHPLIAKKVFTCDDKILFNQP